MSESAEANALLVIEAWVKLRRACSPAAKSEAVCTEARSAIALLLGEPTWEPRGDREDNAAELLEALDQVLGGKAATAIDIVKIATQRGSPPAERLDLALRESLRSRGSPLTARALGFLLSSLKSARLANGKRLAPTGYRDHSHLWRITAPK